MKKYIFTLLVFIVWITRTQEDFSKKLQDGFTKAAESVLEFDNLLPEKAIVVVVPSYNNAKWYKQSLNSVFSQNYDNYRIVYIDDASPDGTGGLVEKYINECHQQHRVTLIKNNKRKLAMANIYNAVVNHCNEDEIILMLDGDDFMAKKNVLKYINHIYSTKNVWLTYGSCLFLTTCTKIGFQEPFPPYVIKNNRFRQFRHGLTHMRTFYAWLFKKVNKKDLLYRGNFISMSSDVAMYTPMIEMAGERHLFIDKILYLYNDLNQISDYRVNGGLQWRLNKYIRSKKKYHRITIEQ